MPKIILIIIIFLIIVLPVWRIMRRIISKAEREFNSDADQFSVDELKRKKKSIEKNLVKEEQELKRKQKLNKKLKKEVVK